jgi:hypothetical protein
MRVTQSSPDVSSFSADLPMQASIASQIAFANASGS